MWQTQKDKVIQCLQNINSKRKRKRWEREKSNLKIKRFKVHSNAPPQIQNVDLVWILIQTQTFKNYKTIG